MTNPLDGREKESKEFIKAILMYLTVIVVGQDGFDALENLIQARLELIDMPDDAVKVLHNQAVSTFIENLLKDN